MELALLAGIGLFGSFLNNSKQNNKNKVDEIYSTDFINQNRNDLANKYKETNKEIKKDNPNIIPPYYNLKEAGILTSGNKSVYQYGTQTDVINTKLANGNVKQDINYELQKWNKDEVVSINEFNKSDIGIQNNLAHNGKWTPYNNDCQDMTFGITQRKDFNICTSYPYNKKRDFEQFNDYNEQREPVHLDIYTGSSKNYIHKKEIEPFFNPVGDITHVYGMPNKTDVFEERYADTIKLERRNEKPFEPQQIGPGLRLNHDVDSLGGFHDTTRVLPKTVDDLRRSDNPKLSYSNDPIIGKRGDKKAVVYPMMKRRPDKFKEIGVDEMLPNSNHVLAPKIRENINLRVGNRVFSSEVIAPASNNIKHHDPQTAGNFQEPTKNIYKSHDNYNLTNNIKQFNNNTNSFNILENERNTSNIDYTKPISNITSQSYSFNPNDITKPTIRQTINNYNNYQNISSGIQANKVEFTDLAKPTIKSLTISEEIAPMSRTLNKSIVFNPNDIAKQTHKQTLETFSQPQINTYQQVTTQFADLANTTNRQTLYNLNHQNINSQQQNVISNFTDLANTTNRQNTNNFNHYNINSQQQNVISNFTDLANTTNRQTLHNLNHQNINSQQQNVISNFTDLANTTNRQNTNYQYSNIMTNVNLGNTGIDDAKTTIKQTTINNDYQYMPSFNQAFTSQYNDLAKTTIKQMNLSSQEGNIGMLNNNYINTFDEPIATMKQLVDNNNYVSSIKDINKPVAFDPNDLAKITQRQDLISYNYDANAGYSNNNGYISNNMEAPTTMKEITQMEDYLGTAINNYENMQRDEYYNAHTNTAREVIAEERTPTLKGGSIANGAESLNIKLKEPIEIIRDNYQQKTKSLSGKNLDDEMRIILSSLKNSPYYNERFDNSILEILDTNPLVNNMVNHKYRE